MNLRYRVDLSEAERSELTMLLSGGRHAARKLKRAQILLKADQESTDAEIVAALRSVARVSSTCVSGSRKAAKRAA